LGFFEINELTVFVSPEKAGVGGSTPSRGTNTSTPYKRVPGQNFIRVANRAQCAANVWDITRVVNQKPYADEQLILGISVRTGPLYWLRLGLG